MALQLAGWGFGDTFGWEAPCTGAPEGDELLELQAYFGPTRTIDDPHALGGKSNVPETPCYWTRGNSATTDGGQYNRILMASMRQYCTHDQIMNRQCQLPRGYGLDTAMFWKSVGDGAVDALKEFGPILKGIASIVSYVPIFGTAVAFVINTGVSLAQGEDISDALLDGVGGALPGQPLTKSAFDMARAVISGKDIEGTLIAAIPVDNNTKGYIAMGVRVAEGIANGRPVTGVALDEIYRQLPAGGREAFNTAKRVASGDSIGGQFADVASALANATQAEKDAYVGNVAYQAVMGGVPPQLRDAVNVGIALGAGRRAQNSNPAKPPVALGRVLIHNAEMDGYAAKGRALMIAGAVWKNSVGGTQLVSDIRNAATRIGTGIPGAPMYPDWQYAFDVGFGLCEGMSLNGPGQQRIRDMMHGTMAVSGFDAAQKIQYDRTNQNQLQKGIDAMALALGKVTTAADRASLVQLAAKGAATASANPQVAAARALNADGRFRWGFDVATGLCEGMGLPGPGQTRYRVMLGPFSSGGGPNGELGSNEAMSGFDVGQALQHGITKARLANEAAAIAAAPPNVGAGMLLANGIAGSGSPGDVKAGVIAQTLNDPGAQAGATQVINDKKGFFAKILSFFGL